MSVAEQRLQVAKLDGAFARVDRTDMKIETELADAAAVVAFIDELHPAIVGVIPAGIVVIADAIETGLAMDDGCRAARPLGSIPNVPRHL